MVAKRSFKFFLFVCFPLLNCGEEEEEEEERERA